MDVTVLIACLALAGTLIIVLVVLCRLIQPYDVAWFLSEREDKIKLSKMKLYNANGYLMHSGSEILLGSTGSFQRFDSVDRDYKPQYGQGSGLTVPPWRTTSTEESEIPPQPLRPAPSPKEPKFGANNKAIQKQTSEPKPPMGPIIISPIPRPVPRKQHSAPISFPLPVLNSSPREKRHPQETHICTNPFLNQPPLKEEVDPPPVPLPPAPPDPPVVEQPPFLQRLIRSANNPFLSDPRKPEDECFFNFEPATVQSVFAEDDPIRRVEKRLSKMENFRKMSRLIESNQVLLNIYQQFNNTLDRSNDPEPTPLTSRTPPARIIGGPSSSSSTSPQLSPKLFDSTSMSSPRNSPPPPQPSNPAPTLPLQPLISAGSFRMDSSKYDDSPKTEAGDFIKVPTVSNSIKHILRNRSFSETEFSERKQFKSMAFNLVDPADPTSIPTNSANSAASSSNTSPVPLMKNSSYKDLTRYYQNASSSSGQSPQPQAGASTGALPRPVPLHKTLSESFLEQYSLGRNSTYIPGGCGESCSSGSSASIFGGASSTNDRLRSTGTGPGGILKASTSSESVASQSSVIFSDLRAPDQQPITGYLCVGLQWDR
ncbi:lysine-specific demethylase 6B-like [Uranotaenia lowii]|uniref:lysine-specific demethylase 6B-like n=1 Tax=Uranotaenia lowii TaxID=190385 RepID=UPI00247A0F83|nr:lysine-specific demethylase 6B-like [Uranotaenia lowii]